MALGYTCYTVFFYLMFLLNFNALLLLLRYVLLNYPVDPAGISFLSLKINPCMYKATLLPA